MYISKHIISPLQARRALIFSTDEFSANFDDIAHCQRSMHENYLNGLMLLSVFYRVYLTYNLGKASISFAQSLGECPLIASAYGL